MRFGSLWRYGVAACLLMLGGCGNSHEQATGTYGRLAGQNPSTGGAGHGYLSA